ncbi:hypothetical protein PoB_000886700 [Plakobranchus ocellatus]|uniref:Uncharacterized protein n=1 Tax=Plakobranchus ocellatus TaxID=259542 RepID=A0AAV3YJ10_9GAST|nr:hypothetical protein PoB_000886700 [Plakobranchus ocellatus]
MLRVILAVGRGKNNLIMTPNVLVNVARLRYGHLRLSGPHKARALVAGSNARQRNHCKSKGRVRQPAGHPHPEERRKVWADI